MVWHCSATECHNYWYPNCGLTFHKFPLTRPETSKKWLDAMRKKDFQPTKFSGLCSAHFTDDSFSESSQFVRHLKKDAVPSIFDSLPKPLQPPAKFPRRVLKRVQVMSAPPPDPIQEVYLPRREDLIKVENNIATPIQVIHLPRTLPRQYLPKKTVKTEDPNRSSLDKTTQTYLESNFTHKACRLRAKELKRQVKTLQQKVRRKDIQIAKMSESIKTFKSRNTLCKTLEDAFSSLSGFEKDLLILNKSKDKNNKLYYSDAVKQFALTLFFYSSEAYDFVRKELTLPHPSTLRSWMSKVNCDLNEVDFDVNEPECNVYEREADASEPERNASEPDCNMSEPGGDVSESDCNASEEDCNMSEVESNASEEGELDPNFKEEGEIDCDVSKV